MAALQRLQSSMEIRRTRTIGHKQSLTVMLISTQTWLPEGHFLIEISSRAMHLAGRVERLYVSDSPPGRVLVAHWRLRAKKYLLPVVMQRLALSVDRINVQRPVHQLFV